MSLNFAIIPKPPFSKKSNFKVKEVLKAYIEAEKKAFPLPEDKALFNHKERAGTLGGVFGGEIEKEVQTERFLARNVSLAGEKLILFKYLRGEDESFEDMEKSDLTSILNLETSFLVLEQTSYAAYTDKFHLAPPRFTSLGNIYLPTGFVTHYFVPPANESASVYKDVRGFEFSEQNESLSPDEITDLFYSKYLDTDNDFLLVSEKETELKHSTLVLKEYNGSLSLVILRSKDVNPSGKQLELDSHLAFSSHSALLRCFSWPGFNLHTCNDSKDNLTIHPLNANGKLRFRYNYEKEKILLESAKKLYRGNEKSLVTLETAAKEIEKGPLAVKKSELSDLERSWSKVHPKMKIKVCLPITVYITRLPFSIRNFSQLMFSLPYPLSQNETEALICRKVGQIITKTA